MKKTLFFFGGLLMVSSFFTSCTKSLKNDINDLKKQVDSLNKYNSELRGQVGNITAILGANEPITSITTFIDNNNVTRTVEDTYKFKANSYSTQRMIKNDDGTYDIYIERFSDVNWNEGAWVAFTYNPVTKALTYKRGGQYWSIPNPYNGNARFDENYYSTGLTLNITINRIDVTTGDISLNFSAAGTAAYTAGINSWYVPNPGKPVSTNFAFTGKLKVLTRD